MLVLVLRGLVRMRLRNMMIRLRYTMTKIRAIFIVLLVFRRIPTAEFVFKER